MRGRPARVPLERLAEERGRLVAVVPLEEQLAAGDVDSGVAGGKPGRIEQPLVGFVGEAQRSGGNPRPERRRGIRAFRATGKGLEHRARLIGPAPELEQEAEFERGLPAARMPRGGSQQRFRLVVVAAVADEASQRGRRIGIVRASAARHRLGLLATPLRDRPRDLLREGCRRVRGRAASAALRSHRVRRLPATRRVDGQPGCQAEHTRNRKGGQSPPATPVVRSHMVEHEPFTRIIATGLPAVGSCYPPNWA